MGKSQERADSEVDVSTKDTGPSAAAQREPLRSIVLNESFGERGSSYLGAEIDRAGALVVSGEDTSPLCEAMSGDLAVDTWLALAPPFKDELLLRLLADRFSSARELTTYLEGHAIPCIARIA